LNAGKNASSPSNDSTHGEKQDADDYEAEHWVVDILPTIFTVLKAFSTQMRWQNVYSEENSGLWC